MVQTRSRIAAVLMVFTAMGCASRAMRPVDPARAVSSPPAGKAVVVFMRPSRIGGAIQSSVFDVVGDSDQFVGIVSSRTKVAYVTAPGQHLFMVIGENADFMAADLSPGKQYYALVTPRVGWWKARFSLRPIRRSELASSDFAGWDSATSFVENTDASRQWATDNAASVRNKRVGYIKKWNAKSQAERDELTLRPEDGK